MAWPVHPQLPWSPAVTSAVTTALQGVPVVRSSDPAIPALWLSAAPRAHRWAALTVLCAAALILMWTTPSSTWPCPPWSGSWPSPLAICSGSSTPTRWSSRACCSSAAAWPTGSAQAVLPHRPGRFRRRIGRRRVLRFGDLLIGWRGVMGAGAALTIPASLSIINDVFRDPAERARAIGAWAATIELGIAIGPIAAACCSPSSGGDQSSWSTSLSWPLCSRAPCCWCPTRRIRPPTRLIPGGTAVDRGPGPAAVGNHRGSR